MPVEPEERGRGLAYILAVYVAWGFMPAYWKLMDRVDPMTILAHRVIWSAAVLLVLGLVVYRPRNILEPLRDRRTLGLCLLASLALLVQWAAYLVAIVTGRLLELSLGYFIYPLVLAFLGAVFLKERMSKAQVAALCVAALGVAVKVVEQGGVPVLALTLAFSFAVYSIAKKKARAKALYSIFYEILFMLPFALGYAAYAEASGAGYVIGPDPATLALLVGGGILTASTLLLFAAGARRIPIFTVGLLQYVSPTIVLLLGAFAYGEAFGAGQAAAFGAIWLAIAITLAPASRRPDARAR